MSRQITIPPAHKIPLCFSYMISAAGKLLTLTSLLRTRYLPGAPTCLAAVLWILRNTVSCPETILHCGRDFGLFDCVLRPLGHLPETGSPSTPSLLTSPVICRPINALWPGTFGVGKCGCERQRLENLRGSRVLVSELAFRRDGVLCSRGIFQGGKSVRGEASWSRRTRRR